MYSGIQQRYISYCSYILMFCRLSKELSLCHQNTNTTNVNLSGFVSTLTIEPEHRIIRFIGFWATIPTWNDQKSNRLLNKMATQNYLMSLGWKSNELSKFSKYLSKSSDKSTIMSVHVSVHHKKWTSPNQQMLLVNVVACASVMIKITLGSPPTIRGLRSIPWDICGIKPKVGRMKKVTDKSCQVCSSDEKNQDHHPTGWTPA